MNTKVDAFKNIAVLAHPQIEKAAREANKIAEFLQHNGVNAVPGGLKDDAAVSFRKSPE